MVVCLLPTIYKSDICMSTKKLLSVYFFLRRILNIYIYDKEKELISFIQEENYAGYVVGVLSARLSSL